jgi:hypothetical protein
VKPSCFNNFPPARASFSPASLSGQSTQPVKRFSLFHVDSPWRINTNVYFMSSCEADLGTLLRKPWWLPPTNVLERVVKAAQEAAERRRRE